jgi:DNA-binding NarL/FixJ family response regulator
MLAIQQDSERIRCVLVDEQVLVRQGIAWLLRKDSNLEFLAEGSSLEEVVRHIGFRSPHVVVVGADQDRHVALETARLTRLQYPAARLVFLLTYCDEAYRTQCERAGVSGFVLKTAPSEDLLAALYDAPSTSKQDIAGGPILIGNESLFSKTTRHARVTPRENEVLRLIAEGNSARAAAAILGISAKTVEAHKFNFMRKLGLHNRAQVITYALRNGLIEMPSG